MGRIIKELEKIYEIRQGGDRSRSRIATCGTQDEQSKLLKELGQELDIVDNGLWEVFEID